MNMRSLILWASLPLVLSGCEMLGLESVESINKKAEAEGQAVGAACRQSGRAIEDCYNLNIKTSKAPIFSGWREMDTYMRENKLEVVVPKIDPASVTPVKAKAKPAAHGETSESEAPSSSQTAYVPPGAQAAVLGAPAHHTAPAAGAAKETHARKASAETSKDNVWNSRTDTKDEAKTSAVTEPAAAPAPTSSPERLAELKSAAERMGLSASVVR